MNVMRHGYFAGRFAMLLVCGALALGAAGCAKASGAGASADAPRTAEIKDPIEPVNRAVFNFNNLLDRTIIEPAAKVYNAVLPNFVRDGIRNFMRNLRSPITVGNALLQGNVGEAGNATARFLINTTAGVGGLVDVAAGNGIPYRREDFGQTMGVWGAGPGFYIVLPLLGPSSLRDASGDFADAWADPVRIWAFKTGHDPLYYGRNVLEGFDKRARLIKAIDDLRNNSLDYYAAVRSAYAQRRASEISNHDGGGAPHIPDYTDEKKEQAPQ
jgi:phospholipid-binding lipoprotein MlaA